MSTPGSHAGESPLDRAHGMRLSGDVDDAMRLALTILANNVEEDGAAMLAAELLVDGGREIVAGEAAKRLVDRLIRRGDLPAAVAAAHLARRAGEDAGPLLHQIARAFAKGGRRLSDVPPAPSPLPRSGDVSPALAKLSGADLLGEAYEQLQAWLRIDDTLPEDTRLPSLPLFASLGPATLQRLLGVLEVKDVAAGEAVVVEGEEGHDAFVVVRGLLEAVRAMGADSLTLAAFGPGSFFGEMALVSDAPRAASVLAREPSRLLVVHRDELEVLAKREPTLGEELGKFCRRRMVSNLLRHGTILSAVTADARPALMARFEPRSFKPGDRLVEQGQERQGLFLIASGGVTVSRDDGDGERLVLAHLGPGDVVGEISLVLRRPATADVVAQHSTVALELTRDRFAEAIKDHPQLLNELYDIAVQRDEETRSVVAQEALDAHDVVLL